MAREGKLQAQSGFTLIELLVVIVVIGILAVIAIPVFLGQRAKAWTSQSQAALRDAATALESYAVDNAGDYSGADGQCSPSKSNPCGSGDDKILKAEGFRKASGVKIEVRADASSFCVTAIHDSLEPPPSAHDWWAATWDSNAPGPSDEDSCPVA